jgi:hypothetical protein
MLDFRLKAFSNRPAASFPAGIAGVSRFSRQDLRLAWSAVLVKGRISPEDVICSRWTPMADCSQIKGTTRFLPLTS